MVTFAHTYIVHNGIVPRVDEAVTVNSLLLIEEGSRAGG